MTRRLNQQLNRRSLLQAGAALCVSLLAPATRACEFFTTTLRVTHPWARATAEGATFAAIYMKFDQVTQTDRLIGVETPVAAGAEMGGMWASQKVSFLIAQGRDSLLREGGTYVRITGLKVPLELGRSYPLKLIFEKGGIVNADLEIDFPAEPNAPACAGQS